MHEVDVVEGCAEEDVKTSFHNKSDPDVAVQVSLRRPMLPVKPGPAAATGAGADKAERQGEHDNEDEEHGAEVEDHIIVVEQFTKLGVLLLIFWRFNGSIKDVSTGHDVERRDRN